MLFSHHDLPESASQVNSEEEVLSEEEEELKELEELKSHAELLVKELVDFVSHIVNIYENVLSDTRSLREKSDNEELLKMLQLNLEKIDSLSIRLDQFKMKLLEIVCKFSEDVHSVFRYYLYEYLPARYYEMLNKKNLVADLVREKRAATALLLFIEYMSDMLDLASQLFSIAKGLAESIGKYYEDFRQYYEQVRRQYERSKEVQSGILPSVI